VIAKMITIHATTDTVRLFEAKYSQGLATNETTEDDAARVLEMLRNRLEEVVSEVFVRYIFR
jgi:hypothetical protein